VPQSPWGVSIQFSLRRGSVAPLACAALHIPRWQTQNAETGCRPVIHPSYKTEREREVSRVNQINTQTYKHQYHIRIHTSIPIQQSPITWFTWVNHLSRPRWTGPCWEDHRCNLPPLRTTYVARPYSVSSPYCGSLYSNVLGSHSPSIG